MQCQGMLETPGDPSGAARTRAGSSSAEFSVKSDIASYQCSILLGEKIPMSSLQQSNPLEREALCHSSRGVTGTEPQHSPGHPCTEAARAGTVAQGRDA